MEYLNDGKLFNIKKALINFGKFALRAALGIKPTPEQSLYYEIILNKSRKRSMYKEYKKNVRHILDEIAVYEAKTGHSYTHRQIIDMVDKASLGLIARGINQDSKIGMILNGSIEEVVSFFAVSNIGATGIFIDYMKPAEAVKETVDQANVDLLIMESGDLGYAERIKSKDLPTIIANYKGENLGENMTSFNSLYEPAKADITYDFCPGTETMEIYSSGSTGAPKIMRHTANSILNASAKLLGAGVPIKGNNASMKIVPPFIGLGVFTSMFTILLGKGHVVLSGGNIALEATVPELINNVKDIIKNFAEISKKMGLKKGAKLNLFVSPDFIREIANDESIKDLSMLGYIMIGGASIDIKEMALLKSKLREKGCYSPICICYGTNEMGGGVTYNTPMANVIGSVGRLTSKTMIKVVDPITLETLGPGKEGLLLFLTDSQCQEYVGDPKKTADSYKVINGIPWFNPGDLGYYNVGEKGDITVFMTGREKRVAIRKDFKAYLDKYESITKRLEGVGDCAVICPNAGGSTEGLAFCIVSNNPNVREDDIWKQLRSSMELFDYEQIDENIDKIWFIDSIPHLPSGKKDYIKLRNMYLEMLKQPKLSLK